MATDATGKTSVIACPGLSGTWPLIDFSRGYAYIILSKSPVNEEKAPVYWTIKEVMDRELIR